MFHYWREVGRRMAIKDIPETFEELERYNVEYERANFRYAESNARVARASRDMFLAWFPGMPKRLGAQAIAALMDDRLREAIGFPRPPRAIVRAVEGGCSAPARARCAYSRRGASRSCARRCAIARIRRATRSRRSARCRPS